MPTYRENPVEPGRYWSDLIGPKAIEDWTSWKNAVNRVGEAGKVVIVKTNHHEPSDGQPVREWVLFEVRSPVAYDHEFYAPMNTAVGVNSEEDTVSRPDPEDLSILPSGDSISRAIRSAATTVTVVVGVVSFAGLAYVVLSNRRRRR